MPAVPNSRPISGFGASLETIATTGITSAMAADRADLNRFLRASRSRAVAKIALPQQPARRATSPAPQVELLTCHAQTLGCFTNGQTQLMDIVPDQFSGVSRIFHRHGITSSSGNRQNQRQKPCRSRIEK